MTMRGMSFKLIPWWEVLVKDGELGASVGIQSKEAGWRKALTSKEAPDLEEFIGTGDWRRQDGKPKSEVRDTAVVIG